MRKPILVAALVGLSTPAHALTQSKHYDTSLASCTNAGLPYAFCRRVAVETYNVDANEWNDLSAHSQVQKGLNACDSANNSVWRVFWLGERIRNDTIAAGYSPSRSTHNQLAQDLGRALHTLQDHCAHKGMPNPQHAWFSLKDQCHGTSESPDVQPDAYGCAAEESDAVFSALTDVLHDFGGDFNQLSDVTAEDDTHYPSYGNVCSFLGEASDWDGVDRRWNFDVVRPALAANIAAAIGGADQSQFARVCTSWENDVEANYSDPDLDTSGGAQSCVKIHAFCLGKADSAAEVAPPWEPAPVAANIHGGCSFGDDGTSGTPAAALLLVGVMLALCVRRGLL